MEFSDNFCINSPLNPMFNLIWVLLNLVYLSGVWHEFSLMRDDIQDESSREVLSLLNTFCVISPLNPPLLYFRCFVTRCVRNWTSDRRAEKRQKQILKQQVQVCLFVWPSFHYLDKGHEKTDISFEGHNLYVVNCTWTHLKENTCRFKYKNMLVR